MGAYSGTTTPPHFARGRLRRLRLIVVDDDNTHLNKKAGGMYTRMYTCHLLTTPYVIAPDNGAFFHPPVFGYMMPSICHLVPLSRMTARTCHISTAYRGTQSMARACTQHMVLGAPTARTYDRMTALLHASASGACAFPFATCWHAI
jgi:hypothetical protein